MGEISMNIQFKYEEKGHKVVVSNEKGILRVIDFQENVEKLLILENVIDTIEKDYKNAISRKEHLSNLLIDTKNRIATRKKCQKKAKFINLALFPGLPLLGMAATYYGGFAPIQTNTIFGVMDLWVVSGTFLGFSGLCGAAINNHVVKDASTIDNLELDCIKLEMVIQSVDKDIEILETSLNEVKKEYSTLKINNTKTNFPTNTNEIFNVEYKERLEKERTYLSLIKKGYNQEQIYSVIEETQLKLERK